MFDLQSYLERIRYRGPSGVDPDTLKGLHRAHLLTVPFENLDIWLGRPIVLDEARFLQKIAAARRGGFCYELNGCFAALLRNLGFQVAFLSARVATEDGFTPEFDHMALRVDLEQPWLADVGFGDSFLEPLPLRESWEQTQQGTGYRLGQWEARWLLERRNPGQEWKPVYDFSLEERQLPDFAARCHYQQTSPESHFTQHRICSLATAEGRITLADMRLIETSRGSRQERPVADEAEYQELLLQFFGIALEP